MKAMRNKQFLLVAVFVGGILVFLSCTRTCPKYPMNAKTYLPVALREITYESGDERMVFHCSETLYNEGGGTTKFGEKYNCGAFLLMTFSDSLGNEISYRNSFSSWKAKEWETNDLSIDWKMEEFHFYKYYSIDKYGSIIGSTEELNDWTSALGECYAKVYRVNEETGSVLYFCEDLGVVQIETETSKVWTLRLSSVK